MWLEGQFELSNNFYLPIHWRARVICFYSREDPANLRNVGTRTRLKQGTSVLYNSFQHYGLKSWSISVIKAKNFPSFLSPFYFSSLPPSLPPYLPSIFPSSFTSEVLGIYIVRFKLRFRTHRFCIEAFFPDCLEISFNRCCISICGNKTPTRCNTWFLLQILLLAQHVSGTIMPIIRSSRVLYKWLLPVVFDAWLRNSPQTRHTTLSTTPYRQLENQASNTTGSSYLYNTLELLMMGIMVPETCWTSNKICNKNHLLHLVGVLFPHINDDARSKPH